MLQSLIDIPSLSTKEEEKQVSIKGEALLFLTEKEMREIIHHTERNFDSNPFDFLLSA